MIKNAGLKKGKEQELFKRLQEGEIFWLDNHRIFFDKTKAYPFRFDDIAVGTCLNFIEKFKVEVEWWDDLSDEPLCEVWDNWEKPQPPILRQIIQRLENNRFLDNKNSTWLNAELIYKDNNMIRERDEQTRGSF